MKIFVSYTSADRDWAHWIAWNLGRAGHEPFVHEWEIGAGQNIPRWMEERLGEADRLVGVFSDTYCKAIYSQSERWAAYWQDTGGRDGFLVPIEISKITKWPVFIEPLKRLSLIGRDESEALKCLIAFLEPPKAPAEKPFFPGGIPSAQPSATPFTEGGDPLGGHAPSFPASSVEQKSQTSSAPSPSPITDPDAGIRCIDEQEPKPLIFGRDDEVETIVGALLAGKMALVAGGPGMGKTAVATVALYDPRVVAQFGRRRVFASLETATEPRAILAKLVETLGLPPTGDEVTLLRIIEANAAEQPIAAILDNAETVFDADRPNAERLLNLVARVNGLSLAVTIRGVPPPVAGGVPIDDLPKLAPEHAREAFIAVAGSSFRSDPDLQRLLEALDGHALSIRLVAAQAIGLPSLKGLRESWDEAHAEILRRPGEDESRLTSVRVSLSLSLTSRRIKATPLARRLLALLALLPAGLSESDVATQLGDRATVTKARANDAVACLHQLRLVERRLDLRLRMLTPLRECAKGFVPFIDSDLNRLIDRYMDITAKAGKINGKDWNQVSDLINSEIDNLDAVCDLAVKANVFQKQLGHALFCLGRFHGVSGRGTAESLEAAATKLRPMPSSQLKANCISCLGFIALERSDLNKSQILFDEALAIYTDLKDARGEAYCIRSIGEILYRRSDYELARRNFEKSLQLARRAKSTADEASCILKLGTIAEQCSDDERARLQYEEALKIYRNVGDLLGEANCIINLGGLAFHCMDLDRVHTCASEAMPLYRHIGNVLGEANCILTLGRVAVDQSNFELARARLGEALVIYRRIGSVQGEAGVLSSFGDIARLHFEFEKSRSFYDEASALFSRSGDLRSQAGALVMRGQCRQKSGDLSGGLADINDGFIVYFRVADNNDLALMGWRALHSAFTCSDINEAKKHRDLARSDWTNIGRLDLVHDWVDQLM